jgi:hypothetical protein
MIHFSPKKHGFEVHHKVNLVVPADREFAGAAKRIAADLARTGCRQVRITTSCDHELELEPVTTIALGSSTNNELIRALYLSARDVTDRAWPGRGGWAIRSVAHATSTGGDALVLSVSEAADAGPIAVVFGKILEGNGRQLPWMHQVEPGRWSDAYLDQIGDLLPTPDASLDRIGGGSGDWDYMMAIGKVGMLAMKTGDESLLLRFATEVPRFLRVRFSERKLEDPIQIHGFLRNLLRPFAMLEHHPALSDSLRREILMGLLEIYRSTEGAANQNLIDDSQYSRVRQNHGTRTAVDIYDGGLYFLREHGLDEGRDWMRLADRFFEPQLASSKPVCDSWGHQWAGSLYNTADYALLAGKFDYFRSQPFLDAADRALMAHTNLESGPMLYLLLAAFVTGNDEYLALCRGKRMALPGISPDVSACTDDGTPGEDQTVRQAIAQLGGDEFGRPWINHSSDRASTRLTGICVAPVARSFFDSIDSCPPYAPPGVYHREIPFESTFDKIAYRPGWRARDTYLLLDGISGGSHSFQDANCLVRFTSHGNSWLGGPEYGRWTTGTLREQNGVSVCCNGEGAGCESRYARLLQAESIRGVGIIHTSLDFPGVAVWSRQIVIHPQGWILVLDECVASKSGVFTLRAQWNLLGDVARVSGVAEERAVVSTQGDARLILRQVGCDDDWLGAVRAGNQKVCTRWNLSRSRTLKTGESVTLATLFHASSIRDEEGPDLNLSGRELSIKGSKHPVVSIWLDPAVDRAKVAANTIRLMATGRSPEEESQAPHGRIMQIAPTWWCGLDSAVSSIETCNQCCLVGTKAGGLYRITDQGLIENRIAVGREVSAVFIEEDGCLLTGGSDGTLCRFDPDGALIWSHVIEWQPMNWDNWTRGNCAILGIAVADCDEGRRIAVGCADRHLYGFDLEGTRLWRSPCKWGPAAHIAIAAIGPRQKNHILVGMARPAIHAWCRVYDPDGNYVRALQRPDIVSWSIPSWITSMDVIDLNDDGRPEIIVGMDTNHRQIVVYRSEGTVLWEADVGSSVTCMEHAHGRLFVGTEGGWIHSFDYDGRRRSATSLPRPIRGLAPLSPDRHIAVLEDGCICTDGQVASTDIGGVVDSTRSTAYWPGHGLLVGSDDPGRVALFS